MKYLIIILFALLPALSWAAVPSINTVSDASTVVGTTYTASPSLSAGSGVTWTKEFGPDDMTVNSSTGAVSWVIPSNHHRESYHLGVRATNGDGSVYTTWILKVGGGSYIYCGTGEPSTHDTISECTALASPGDTIVVRDGTYTGSANMMTNNQSGDRGQIPPSGSSGVYTTIMAERPGGALIDGEGARAPIYWVGNYDSRDGQAHVTYNAQYIALKGFVIGRSNAGGPVFMNHVRNIKIIDVGAYDQATGDSGAVINVARSGYILVEGSYTWGNGREGIMLYICDNSIMRRNVVRIDRTNAPEPMAGIVNYASQSARTQNSIVIDSDQYNYYTYSYIAGAFNDSSGGARYSAWGAIKDVKTVSSIALNVLGAFTVTVQNDNESDPTTFENVAGWDVRTLPAGPVGGGGSPYPVINTPGDLIVNQSTFGRVRSPYGSVGTGAFFSGWAGTDIMTNSIIYDVDNYGGSAGPLFYLWETANFNNIYDVGTINVSESTVTNTINTDPTLTCLKYLPRIEPGCSLQTAGLAGARVGANIMYMRGKSGTMWGETGYDSTTTTSMWPFPHEALIKSKMQAYRYDNGNLTGDRGFASSTAKQLDGVSNVTLTSYIWEYLGNEMPSDIYSESEPPVTGGIVIGAGNTRFGTGNTRIITQ